MTKLNAAQVLSEFIWKNEFPLTAIRGSVSGGFSVDQQTLLTFLMKFQEWVNTEQPKEEPVITEAKAQITFLIQGKSIEEALEMRFEVHDAAKMIRLRTEIDGAIEFEKDFPIVTEEPEPIDQDREWETFMQKYKWMKVAESDINKLVELHGTDYVAANVPDKVLMLMLSNAKISTLENARRSGGMKISKMVSIMTERPLKEFNTKTIGECALLLTHCMDKWNKDNPEP